MLGSETFVDEHHYSNEKYVVIVRTGGLEVKLKMDSDEEVKSWIEAIRGECKGREPDDKNGAFNIRCKITFLIFMNISVFIVLTQMQ